jgi:hypothetical protein
MIVKGAMPQRSLFEVTAFFQFEGLPHIVEGNDLMLSRDAIDAFQR